MYYIKATNTETGKTLVMEIPVFTSRENAEKFAESFINLCTPVTKLEVIKDK